MGFRLANVDGRAALFAGGHYYDLETISASALSSDPMAALDHPAILSGLSGRLDDATPSGSLASVRLGPPVPRPQKVFGIGLNYLDHAMEGNTEPPKRPLVFAKFSSCIAGPTADIEMRGDFVDYEGELVVVIGPGGKDIDESEAWDHVVGLTVGQDISDRRMQFAASPPHFDLGKSFDTYGPIGPVLVSLDEVGDHRDLRLRTLVNGETRQEGSTAKLIFDVPTLISYLSRVTSLVTGDLIFTGTPAGVGGASGRFLRHGDVVTTIIDGIGTLTNRCVRV